jgi:release factor glutamine methyltransferase
MATPASPAGSAAARAGLRAVLAAHADRLAAAGVEEPRLEAERICAWVLATDRLHLHLDRERALAPAEAAAIAAAVARRAARAPLAYVLGTQPFRGLMLRVGPAVLVPRPETEEVVEAALAVLDTMGGARRAALDLGTGSGCIALALAQERPELIVTAVEASADALAVARENAGKTGLAGRVTFLEGDLYGPLAAGARFDLIVSNPPYLTPDEWDAAPPEVRAEPRAALVGGADGLAVHRAVLAGAGARLRRGGAVVLEIGATQGGAVAGIARAAGFAQVDVRRDLAGRDRIVVARRSP